MHSCTHRLPRAPAHLHEQAQVAAVVHLALDVSQERVAAAEEGQRQGRTREECEVSRGMQALWGSAGKPEEDSEGATLLLMQHRAHQYVAVLSSSDMKRSPSAATSARQLAKPVPSEEASRPATTWQKSREK